MIMLLYFSLLLKMEIHIVYFNIKHQILPNLPRFLPFLKQMLVDSWPFQHLNGLLKTKFKKNHELLEDPKDTVKYLSSSFFNKMMFMTYDNDYSQRNQRVENDRLPT